jgi:hypothetical protein
MDHTRWIVNPLPVGHAGAQGGGMDDRRTDMTADNIAPEDEPTPDPANTQVDADAGVDRSPTIRRG